MYFSLLRLVITGSCAQSTFYAMDAGNIFLVVKLSESKDNCPLHLVPKCEIQATRIPGPLEERTFKMCFLVMVLLRSANSFN
jgi:hypothetical protein